MRISCTHVKEAFSSCDDLWKLDTVQATVVRLTALVRDVSGSAVILQ